MKGPLPIGKLNITGNLTSLTEQFAFIMVYFNLVLLTEFIPIKSFIPKTELF